MFKMVLGLGYWGHFRGYVFHGSFLARRFIQNTVVLPLERDLFVPQTP